MLWVALLEQGIGPAEVPDHCLDWVTALELVVLQFLIMYQPCVS